MASGITGPHGHYMSRPAVLEDEATARAIRLARFVDAPLYVVHVQSKGAAEEVSRARDLGQRVVGEAVIQGIACDESQVRHPDFKVAAQFVMSPPIRRREVDGVALKKMLVSGSLSHVGSDHGASVRPHSSMSAPAPRRGRAPRLTLRQPCATRRRRPRAWTTSASSPTA